MPYKDNLKKKEYQKKYGEQYREINKERIKESSDLYRFKNQDVIRKKNKESSKKYKEQNPEKIKEYRQKNRELINKKRHEYYLSHKDESKKQSREYYKIHSEYRKTWGRLARQRRREEWYNYFKEVGKDKCFECGYNKCFGAIDFHHINPSEKEVNISIITGRKISEKNKKEVEKCVSLCSNCHRELHYLINCQNGSHKKCSIE